jgi:hypothetical protein
VCKKRLGAHSLDDDDVAAVDIADDLNYLSSLSLFCVFVYYYCAVLERREGGGKPSKLNRHVNENASSEETLWKMG